QGQLARLGTRATGPDTVPFGIDPVTLAQPATQGLVSCQQRGWCGALQRPGETQTPAVGVVPAHRLPQRPADGSHTDLGRLWVRRCGDTTLAVAIDQQVVYLQQQRRSGGQAELARHRGAVRATDPDTDQMARADTDGPGIAKAVAGAGLPGQGR